jgi:Ca2+-binding EF-hand superfamily protein
LALLLTGCGVSGGAPTPASAESLSIQSKAKISKAVRSILELCFDLMDNDQDDFLSPGELGRKKVNGADFKGLDKSGDGKLSFSEFAPAATIAAITTQWRDTMTQSFTTADGNTDKVLEKKEWVKKWPVPFDDADEDGNGKVRYSEFESVVTEHSRMQKPSVAPLPIVKPGKPPAPPAPPPGPPEPPAPPAPPGGDTPPAEL